MPASTPAPGGPTALLALTGSGGVPQLPTRRPGQQDQPPRRARPLLIALVLLSTGLLLTVAATSTRRSAPERSRQRSAIQAMVDARTTEVAGLMAARQRLRQQIVDARSAAATATSETRAVQTTVRRLAASAGVVPVAGPGASVLLRDPRSSGAPHRISDTEIAQVVNVLWAAGAEAVAVNDVRLTARSAIRSAGDAVLVNFRPISPPYRVAAIGAPDALTAGFAGSAIAAQLRTEAAVYGGEVSVTVADRVALPAAAATATTPARPAAGTSIGVRP